MYFSVKTQLQSAQLSPVLHSYHTENPTKVASNFFFRLLINCCIVLKCNHIEALIGFNTIWCAHSLHKYYSFLSCMMFSIVVSPLVRFAMQYASTTRQGRGFFFDSSPFPQHHLNFQGSLCFLDDLLLLWNGCSSFLEVQHR